MTGDKSFLLLSSQQGPDEKGNSYELNNRCGRTAWGKGIQMKKKSKGGEREFILIFPWEMSRIFLLAQKCKGFQRAK